MTRAAGAPGTAGDRFRATGDPMHTPAPNSQPHDPDEHCTTLIHLTDAQARIADILGINTRGTPGHWQARLTHTEQRRIRRLQDLMDNQAAMGGDAA